MTASRGGAPSGRPAGAELAAVHVLAPRDGAPDQPDPALALLQHHQVAQITPRLVADAERRLQSALLAARNGRTPDPGLLLRQVATDLGITLTLH